MTYTQKHQSEVVICISLSTKGVSHIRDPPSCLSLCNSSPEDYDYIDQLQNDQLARESYFGIYKGLQELKG